MITKETVVNVAKLAKLELAESEIGKMTEDLNNVITYIDQLTEVDVSNVQPLENINEGVEKNVFRKDEVIPSLPVGEALKNAPKAADNYFLVPKVLQQEIKNYVEQDITGNEEEELPE
jgi:aspartyl-tRNA(Asn)/glutamyl-tRNA(Gln) amidotransferase subunit C